MKRFKAATKILESAKIQLIIIENEIYSLQQKEIQIKIHSMDEINKKIKVLQEIKEKVQLRDCKRGEIEKLSILLNILKENA